MEEVLKKRTELTEKITLLENVEKQYIGLRNLADTKRDQLIRAVTELDQANLKILELTRAFEISKTKNNYLNNTISSLKSRFETVEVEFEKNKQKSFEDDERISKIASENSTLREEIHRSQIDSMELKRSLDNVKMQLKNKKLLAENLKNRLISPEFSVTEFQHQMRNFKVDMEKAKNMVRVNEELIEKIKFNETIKVRCEREENKQILLKEEMIFVKSTVETLKSSLKGAMEGMLDPNFVSSVLLKKWQKEKKILSDEMKMNNEILSKTMASLREKKFENGNIILELSKYQRENEKLRIAQETDHQDRRDKLNYY